MNYIDLSKFTNLVIGYGIGTLLFSYIFHQFFKYGVISPAEISNASLTMPFLALTFCYFARAITRMNGRFSWRIYVNGVTAIASLIFLVNTAIDNADSHLFCEPVPLLPVQHHYCAKEFLDITM